MVSLVVLPASPAAAATKVKVQAGSNGTYRFGKPFPVRATVTSDRLVRGTLEFSMKTDFGPAVSNALNVPVEVSGGSTKQYVVALPGEMWGDRLDISVVLREDGKVVGSGTAKISPIKDEEQVGVLARALNGRTLPARVPLAIDIGTASFVALDELDLSGAPGTLGVLGTVVASTDDLAGLDQDARKSLFSWVGLGGRLLVDALPGQEVPGLLPEWQPGASARATAGLGEVRAVGDAIATGRWSEILEPTPTSTFNQMLFESPDRPLAEDAGLRIPKLGWLISFLVVYVIGAVPITLTILRRRGHGEWGWIALPVVALVFTGVAWFVGSEVRANVVTSHATVLRTSPNGATASSYVGTHSRSGGDIITRLPRSWTPISSGIEAAVTKATVGAGGVEVRQRLDAGQFAVQRLWAQ